MKQNGLFLMISLCLCIGAGCSCVRNGGTDQRFARQAAQLLDSTFKYYRVEQTALFHENYPQIAGETVSYLAGEDTVTQDKVAYLWPTSGLFSAVNALLHATGDAKYRDLLETVILPGLAQYADTTRLPHSYQSYLAQVGHSDRFYDDNIWLGIDFLESYALIGKPSYLAAAEEIWQFLESGRDTVLGDGIYWCEQKRFSKNTCSNAPASVLALKLYQATQKERYLQAGKELYHWTQTHLQDPADGLYWDNMALDGTIGKAKYAYNSGQMMQAAALLHRLTGEKRYLTDARRLAEACDAYFFCDCELSEVPFRGLKNGNVWFAAVMLRGYEELYRIDWQADYLNRFRATLDYLWETNPNANRLLEDDAFCEKLSQPKAQKWLLTQAAMIEMYARLSLQE